MIGIIDYGMGNLHSVANALNYIEVENFISDDIKKLKTADKLILPGVGAFKVAMEHIKDKGFDKLLHEAKEEKKHILGICLGMQLFFDSSSEFGEEEGLHLLEGKIVKIDVPLKIPHMGWNDLDIKKETPLFKHLGKNPQVYYVHSYYLETTKDIVIGTTNYGKTLQTAAENENVHALQFHPEKSGITGLTILKNFANL